MHHPAAENLQPLPRLADRLGADIDLGIDGSVNGKCEARKRIFTSSTSKNALQNSSSTHPRCPMCGSSRR